MEKNAENNKVNIIFENLNDNKNIPKISCIYLLTNKINGKIYIGKSVNLQKRLYHHKHNADRKKDYKTPLKNSIIKHGWENFSCRILEESTKDKLEELENNYIESFKSYDRNIGYNILRIGFNRLGTKHSNETKLKISKGTKKSAPRGDEHYTVKDKNINNIKNAHISNTGKTRPDWVKEKISKANKGKDCSYLWKKVKQICPITGETIKIWESMVAANLGMGKKITNTSIRGVCLKYKKLHKNGNRYIIKIAFGYKWEYVLENEINS